MSIFKDILSGIFGHAASAETPSSPQPSASAPAPQAQAAPSGSVVGGPKPSASAPAPQPQPASRGSAAAGPVGQGTVDVAAVLDALAKQKKQKLNWRKSIVDLMKLLDLDSSATARKRLADELHYQEDKKNSAKMNIWLHKQVMIKLAENGGKVPDDLRR
jgi:hypothetical protein